MGVSEYARGKGVASQLLDHASNYFSSKGCHCFTVATQTSNLPAINLYIKNNFQVKNYSIWLYKALNNH
ncbi:GNAT family N-acetyltransferase [Aliivibrio salmonicida]|uniref:GNAT family N-acetyltransferase n=1 Tax=Aliivibrio salmonicida TaxID=40269 RepID=UPI003BF4E5FA